MKMWLSLITSLPTSNATVRMRAWRALKSSGAAVLHDGVYLMPDTAACEHTINSIAGAVREGGGTARVLRLEQPAGENFEQLFDRSADYAGLLAKVTVQQESLTATNVTDTLKKARKLRKIWAMLGEIDFFPGAAKEQTAAALQALELACARILSPDEPQALEGTLSPLKLAEHRNRLWATRQRPWVDRLASAWLIQRFIDSDARFLWLATPADCPADALGFDFDGATFSHVGQRVTFEVLLTRFGLTHGALDRIGALVHYLDVGGVQPPEAAGVETVLAGLRETITDDDRLILATHCIFDGLLASFTTGTARS